MSDRVFKIALSVAELEALIQFHSTKLALSKSMDIVENFTTETSQRIHDLMKRLHRGSEPDISNDPRPQTEENKQSGDW